MALQSVLLQKMFFQLYHDLYILTIKDLMGGHVAPR